MFSEALFYLFIACTVIQLIYWWGVFFRLARYEETSESPINEEKKVSIVICAHNEEENLRKNLPHILNQNYRSFELVVVNHNSSDQSGKVLAEYQGKFPYLRIVDFDNMNQSLAGKKKALERGIAEAKNNVLLLTDADCKPTTENWLKEMQNKFRGDKKIVLGFSPYRKKKGLLNLFIRYETIYTAIQYFSFALAKMPYMGVGRNLAYHKDLFAKANGFKNHEHITSGDDDLFVNQVATSENVEISLKEETFVLSEPKETWGSFFRQKARHLTTGTAYKGKHQFFLALLSATHFGHYLLGGLLLFSQCSTWNAVILLYMVRISSVTVLHYFLLKKFREMSMLKWIPILDALLVIYYIIFAPYLFTGNRKTWT